MSEKLSSFPEPFKGLHRNDPLPRHFTESLRIYKIEKSRSDSPLRQFDGQFVAIVDGVIITNNPSFARISREVRGGMGHYGHVLLSEVKPLKDLAPSGINKKTP